MEVTSYRLFHHADLGRYTVRDLRLLAEVARHHIAVPRVRDTGANQRESVPRQVEDP